MNSWNVLLCEVDGGTGAHPRTWDKQSRDCVSNGYGGLPKSCWFDLVRRILLSESASCCLCARSGTAINESASAQCSLFYLCWRRLRCASKDPVRRKPSSAPHSQAPVRVPMFKGAPQSRVCVHTRQTINMDLVYAPSL